MTYNLSKHAIDRASLRFGISPAAATEWVNELMAKAVLLTSQRGKQDIYDSDGIRLIIDSKTDTVITIHAALTTSFLKPTLDRELRKLKRDHTKQLRQMELDQALTMQKYATTAVNKARARNPEVRDGLERKMVEFKAIIDGYETRMNRLIDDYEAKVKSIEVISM